jgi:hypothetical protein
MVTAMYPCGTLARQLSNAFFKPRQRLSWTVRRTGSPSLVRCAREIDLISGASFGS